MSEGGISKGTVVAVAVGMVVAVAAGVFVAWKKAPVPRRRHVQLPFTVRRGDQTLPGTDGQALQPGDRVQLQLTPETDGYLTVLVRDHSGDAAVLFPGAERTEKVKAGVPMTIDHRDRDDPAGVTRVWGLLCARQQKVEALRRSLQSSVHGFLPPAYCQQYRAHWTR